MIEHLFSGIDWACDPVRARMTALVATLITGNALGLGLGFWLGSFGEFETHVLVIGVAIGNGVFVALERARVV